MNDKSKVSKIAQDCERLLNSVDSCCRRRIIIEVDLLLQELWSEHNFCQIEKTNEITRISRLFFEALDTIDFTSG